MLRRGQPGQAVGAPGRGRAERRAADAPNAVGQPAGRRSRAGRRPTGRAAAAVVVVVVVARARRLRRRRRVLFRGDGPVYRGRGRADPQAGRAVRVQRDRDGPEATGGVGPSGRRRARLGRPGRLAGLGRGVDGVPVVRRVPAPVGRARGPQRLPGAGRPVRASRRPVAEHRNRPFARRYGRPPTRAEHSARRRTPSS